ncbi:MAG: metal ABC transporter substrate-binding protein, partial [Phycisphaerales bacterium JB039]
MTLPLRPAALLTALLLLAPGCAPEDAGHDPQGLQVVVSVPPLAGVIGPMLPEGAQVTTLVGPGQSPHGFELTPSQVSAVRQADIVVLVGLNFEPHVERALRASAVQRVLRFADIVGIEAEDDAHDHDHADHEGHDHGPVDPHLWVDPELVRQFVIGASGEIEQALGGPPATDEPTPIQQARVALVERIAQLDAQYRQRLEPFAGEAIVTSHDAFPRLAERYGLRIGAVIQPIGTQEPTMASLTAAAEAVRDAGARAVFVEPQTPSAGARRLASVTGAAVGTLDPLGSVDWFAMMEA